MSSTLVDESCPAAPVVAVVARPARMGAWSWPGAIAAVIASGATPRFLRRSARLGLLVSGSVVIAAGVAVVLWGGLGAGPLDVFIGAIRVRSGLSLTLSLWLVIASLIAASWAMGRRPGPGTLMSAFIVGPSMQASLSALDTFEPPDSLVLALAIHVAAVFVVGVGAGALIVSGLGAGAGELLASAASDRSGRPEPRVRMAFELTWLVAGIALGGPIGIGTVVFALAIGPAVAVGHRVVDTTAATLWTRSAGVRHRSVRARMRVRVRVPVPVPAAPVAEYCDVKQ